jgi:hypothetical protein
MLRAMVLLWSMEYQRREHFDQVLQDLASFTAGKLNISLARARRMQLPSEITQGMPRHSHKAIDDARGYGVILRNVLKAAKI